MSTIEKIKIGLDETRMLALGAQVLIGFQCQGVFQPRFAELHVSSRAFHVAALVLLIASLGALVAPSAWHILVERLEATRRMESVITACLDLALLPLACALGLDVFIAVRAAIGDVAGMAAGSLVFAGAAFLWLGWNYSRRRTEGKEERAMAADAKSEETPLSKQIEHMLTEARTVLPGAQALLGFQLAVVLTEAFAKLSDSLKTMHVAALLLIALTVMLLMMPAAYHRIVFAGEDSKNVLKLGSWTITLATLPLAAALSLDTYVVVSHALNMPGLAGWIASGMCIALVAAWLVYPLLARRRR